YLAYMTTHTVEIQGHQLLITLADAGTRTADAVLPASTETARAVAPTAPSNPSGTIITGITFEARAEHSIVSLQMAGTPPQVQVKQQQNPSRLALDIKPAHLSPTQEQVIAVSDPEGVVSHLEAVPVTDAQEEAVKVVIHLQTAASDRKSTRLNSSHVSISYA